MVVLGGFVVLALFNYRARTNLEISPGQVNLVPTDFRNLRARHRCFSLCPIFRVTATVSSILVD